MKIEPTFSCIVNYCDCVHVPKCCPTRTHSTRTCTRSVADGVVVHAVQEETRAAGEDGSVVPRRHGQAGAARRRRAQRQLVDEDARLDAAVVVVARARRWRRQGALHQRRTQLREGEHDPEPRRLRQSAAAAAAHEQEQR